MGIEKAQEEALFKYGIIAPVCGGFLAETSKEAFYRMAAEKEYTLPDGSKRKFSPCTIKKWAILYKSRGLNALMPKGRSDSGNPEQSGKRQVRI